jgi:P-type conjugative transfer protein TrbG
MTDDVTTPSKPRPLQRLDGPEALLTAEWNVEDLPWITPEETPEAGAAPTSERALPPQPPSQRGGPPTAFTAGAAAPLGATGTQMPLVTFVKPRKTEIAMPPSVVLAPDLGATLPPRAEREAAASPSAERNVPAPKPRSGHPSFVVVATSVGCVLGCGLWIAVLRPAAANVAPERRLPSFLRESPVPAISPSVAGSVGLPHSASTLPPSLAATLARALPEATSEPARLAGDAGAAGAPPAPIEDTAAPTPESDSLETRRRAELLRSALETQRLEPAADLPVAKPRPSMPTSARPSPKPRPALGNPSPRDTGRGRKSPAAEPLEPTEAQSPRARVRPLTTYTYEDKALFAVATAPLRVTDITLEAGETLVSQPTAGDAARWVISVMPGGDRSHVFVKPLRPGLRTNLTLTTNRRSYFLELSCRDDGTYMAGVVWQYPGDERARRREALARAERERQSTTAVSDLQALRFDYRIEGSPSWTPTMVFDDGAKTFIRFPRPVSSDQAPALFLLRSGSARDATYVNYRIKGDLYVVDRLIEAAELRLANDDDDPDVVRITRTH